MRSLILVGAAALMLVAGCTNLQRAGSSSTTGVGSSDLAHTSFAPDTGDARAASGKNLVARVVGDTEDVWHALFSGNAARPTADADGVQSDCFAGVWTHYVQQRGLLDAGDLEEGVPAALAVGDPLILGDTAQRTDWFTRGLVTGDPRSC